MKIFDPRDIETMMIDAMARLRKELDHPKCDDNQRAYVEMALRVQPEYARALVEQLDLQRMPTTILVGVERLISSLLATTLMSLASDAPPDVRAALLTYMVGRIQGCANELLGAAPSNEFGVIAGRATAKDGGRG